MKEQEIIDALNECAAEIKVTALYDRIQELIGEYHILTGKAPRYSDAINRYGIAW